MGSGTGPGQGRQRQRSRPNGRLLAQVSLGTDPGGRRVRRGKTFDRTMTCYTAITDVDGAADLLPDLH